MQAKVHSRAADAPQLLVEVQSGVDVTVPECCDFSAIATSAFAAAVRRGWAAGFIERAPGVSDVELCLRFVDAAEGQQLNRDWRGKAVATNILSFTADIVAGTFAPLGDLVLCVPVVQREALEQQKTEADHFSHLLVHGLLHLLGYDHVDETEAEVMEAMEVAMLSELGVDNPYE